MKSTLIDRLLMVLAAVAIVLLAIGTVQAVVPQTKQTAEATATEPVQSPCADVVVLAVAPESTSVPEPSPTPDPSPTPEPDKPAYNPTVPLAADLQIILWEACKENGVDLALAMGVIEVESSFQLDAVNQKSGCYGLMQLNPRYFPADLPPGENIQVGVEYLGQLLARYDTVEATLTAYNAGHDTGKRGYANAVFAAAERWRDVIWVTAQEVTP